MARTGAPAAMLGPLLLLGFGNGIAVPGTVAGALAVRPALAGIAAGVVGAAQIGGGALGGAAVTLLADLPALEGTAWPVLAPMVAGAALAFIFSIALVGAGRRAPDRALRTAAPGPAGAAIPR